MTDGPKERATRALTLRQVDYAEADRIVTFFTEDFGKRAVFVAGARKSKKGYLGALQPFRISEIRYRERNADTLARLITAQTLETFDRIPTDLHVLYWASVTLEWTEQLTVEGEPSPLFATLSGLLRWLEGEERGPWHVETGCLRFGLIALSQAGFMPSLARCVRTGTPSGQLDNPFFAVESGGLISSEAIRPEDDAQPISERTLGFLDQLGEGRFPEDRDLDTLRAGRQIVLQMFRAAAEREPHALPLLRTLWL